jgi:hypothetical protein
LNSSIVAVNTDVFGSALAYNQTTPTGVVRTADPVAEGSIKYPLRIEAGSPLASAGFTLDITKRIGTDGSRVGNLGYNTPSAASLWPWPNEERIKREMCAATTRGFCSVGKRLDGINPVTLTSYIWEALGSPIAAGIYP